jgi:predicted DCC family thiol-disulfide oxidoreductase YuxK
MTPDHVILYDADCGFCRWSLDKILAWDRDRRLRPVALQSPESNGLLPGMPEDAKFASWHLVDPSGRVFSAGAAAPPLLRLLPAGAPLAAVAASLPGPTNAAYLWVARHRTWLGERLGVKACSVTPGQRRAGR